MGSKGNSVAIIAQKGGRGKTTLAVHMAVCSWDINRHDPQAPLISVNGAVQIPAFLTQVQGGRSGHECEPEGKGTAEIDE